VRLGCAVAFCNIFGCSMFTMPCWESIHSGISTLSVEKMDYNAVSGVVHCIERFVASECEPFLKSAMSWVSQIIHYAMCNARPNQAAREEGLEVSFAKGSYLGMCMKHLQAYGQSKASTQKEDLEKLEGAATCALRCLKHVQDTDTLNTVQVAFGVLSRHIEVRKDSRSSVIETCYDVISTHKSTKDCLVFKDTGKMIQLFRDGHLGKSEASLRMFFSNLDSILAISDEENARTLFTALTKFKAGPGREDLSITLWNSICTYVKTICARKPRRYKLIRDSIISFAVHFMRNAPEPSYESVLSGVFAMEQGGGQEAASVPSECVWFSVSTCMLEWQLSDPEFSYSEEVASQLSEEKTFLVIMMSAKGKVGLADLIRCQKWYLSSSERGARPAWLLPVLTMHIVHVLEAGKVDLKQWMLDAFEEEAYGSGSLALFAAVILRLSPHGSRVCSDAALWIGPDFSLQMLPYGLPCILRDFPRTFCTLFAHRFLQVCCLQRHRTQLDALLATFISIKEYFSSDDADNFLSLIS